MKIKPLNKIIESAWWLKFWVKLMQ